MPQTEEQIEEQIKSDFTKVLNRHGYGFHYSVLKKLYELNREGKSSLVFETVEFPVEIKGFDTRIDIVLKRRESRDSPFFVLAECKRANPAISNWCFVKAPYTNRKFWAKNEEPVFLEYIRVDGRDITAYAKPRSFMKNIYHVGLEVRSNEKGDSQGASGRAIEDASTQILRGLNGFVQTLRNNIQLIGEFTNANVLPVIFTTAQLWASDVNLSEGEIESGKNNLDGVPFRKVSWLCYQYHLSPGIKHDQSPDKRPSQISDLITTEYIRTIPIVNVEGIGEFTKWASYQIDLDDY